MSRFDRSDPPGAGPMRVFDFPDVDVTRLATGLEVRVARLSRLPVVSVNLFMPAGEFELDPDRAGLSVLTGDVLEGGTRKRSGAELDEAMESVGARMGVSTGWEGTNVSISCLADRLPAALEILAEAVLEPDFPEEEFARARDQSLAAIRQRAMDPSALASDQASMRYFAPGVPYARPLGGTVESVSALGRDDLRGYADAWYRPGTLVVVGDIDSGEMEEMAAGVFSGWEGVSPPRRDGDIVPPTRERKIHVVDLPGAVQSEIRVGHVTVGRSHPDVFSLVVANTLLGGAFTSRLNLNLRERNGFTYGVRSRFNMRNRGGCFEVSTAVGAEVTDAAVREIMTELETLVREGPTEEEVRASRDYVAGVFPLQLETAGQVASRMTEVVVYGLPEDYHRTYRDRIRGVTVDDAARAVGGHVRPGEAQIVVVGNAEEIVPRLEALGLGPVEVG